FREKVNAGVSHREMSTARVIALETRHARPIEVSWIAIVRFHRINRNRMRRDGKIQAVKAIKDRMSGNRFARQNGFADAIGGLAELVRLRIPNEQSHSFSSLCLGINAEWIGIRRLRSPRAAAAAARPIARWTKVAAIGVRWANTNWVPKPLGCRWIP